MLDLVNLLKIYQVSRGPELQTSNLKSQRCQDI